MYIHKIFIIIRNNAANNYKIVVIVSFEIYRKKKCWRKKVKNF